MLKSYITLQEYVQRHSWPPIGGLRHLVRNAKTNGLDEADVVSRVGRRLLIDEQAFIAWIGSKNYG
jgi:hypothetical protein